MLTTIKDILFNFYEVVMSIVSFIQGLIDKLVYFFKLVASGVTYAYEVVATLPTWIQVFAIAAISISVIYLIIGRNTN